MFKDRKDAAERLALALHQYRNENVLVLGIPTGGIEVAYHLAKELNGELSFIITRDIYYPTNPSTSFGAIAEDGSEHISTAARKHLSLEDIESVVEAEKHALQHEIKVLRADSPFPQLYNKTVVIADDGSASAATLITTIDVCQNHLAARTIVALPTGNDRLENLLREKVDEVVILEKLHFYTAVEDSYEKYHHLSEEGAMQFLQRWEQESKEFISSTH